MLKAFKTEINPTQEQKIKIHKTIGTCRYMYNFYISYNKELHSNGKKFMSTNSFSVWLNNEFLPNHPEYSWIKEVSSKSVKQSLVNANTAFTKFFNGLSGFPRYKKKSNSDVKMYFVKNDKNTIIPCERHRIKIPTLGWVRLKEKGYIPITKSRAVIKSGSVSMKAGKYYVSVLVDIQEKTKSVLNDFGIGVDLGVKEFAVCSNGEIFKNINKSARIKKLEKCLKRQQRKLSRKYENFKKLSNKEKGEATRQNIKSQLLKVQKIHQKLANIRTDYINKVIVALVKTKPMWITLEDLNVKGMMKNRHLSKAIARQNFSEFRTKLQSKCKEYGIELRIVDRFYPSSKLCHNCGRMKNDLKLSDRIYTCCQCGYKVDRDFNASLNLRDAITYKIA